MKISLCCSRAAVRNIQLANYLEKFGYLYRLYLPYDMRKIPYNLIAKIRGKSEEVLQVPKNKAYTSLLYSLATELIGDYKPFSRLVSPSHTYLLGALADFTIAPKLKPGSDILIAESNIALKILKQAKRDGALAVLDRTNSHIKFQAELLISEYRRFGLEYRFDKRLIERGIQEYESADYIFVLSDFVKRSFEEKGIPPEKIRVVPSGIDIETFRFRKKKPRVFRVIFCGGINIKKGIPYLVQAFNELGLKNSELVLIGPMSPEIKPILEQYKGTFRHISWVPRRELHRYLCSSSVFVLPSIEEGLAKVIIEAMACGLPVIATTNTGAENVIKNGKEGFIVPIRDVEALKDRMKYLYRHPQVRWKMGKLGRKKVEKQFTTAHYAQRVITVCKQIMGEKNAVTSRQVHNKNR